MSILVSVNCMTYNHEDFIADAIDGFLMQKTNFDFEILIGEDCSTDNTRKIVETYVKKFPEKIRLITSEENIGAKKNSERLLANSRGEYIAVCEGDDYWIHPDKLQKQVDYMESHPECSLCFHAAEIVNEKGESVGNDVRPYKSSGISLTEEIIAGGGEFCATASLLFRKKTMENPPNFFMEAHVGDYPLQMWTASQGTSYYIDEIMAAYRVGVKGSWTSELNSGANIIEKNIKVKEADMKLLDSFNKETNFQYSEVIEKTKGKREFEILLLENKIEKMKTAKYKVYFAEMSKLEKSKVYIRAIFPKLYARLVNMKRGMNVEKRH